MSPQRQEEKNQRRLVRTEASVLRKAREGVVVIRRTYVYRETVVMCPQRHEERNQRRLVRTEENVQRKARDGGLVTTSSNVSPETQREEPAETSSNRRKCAAEGTRGGLVITKRRTRDTKRRTSGVFEQKQVWREKHEREE